MDAVVAETFVEAVPFVAAQEAFISGVHLAAISAVQAPDLLLAATAVALVLPAVAQQSGAFFDAVAVAFVPLLSQAKTLEATKQAVTTTARVTKRWCLMNRPPG